MFINWLILVHKPSNYINKEIENIFLNTIFIFFEFIQIVGIRLIFLFVILTSNDDCDTHVGQSIVCTLVSLVYYECP